MDGEGQVERNGGRERLVDVCVRLHICAICSSVAFSWPDRVVRETRWRENEERGRQRDLFHLLWQCKHMFSMPIKLFLIELN